MTIAFPNINPVIVRVWGPFALSWYSLAYVLGILSGIHIARIIIQKYKLPITSKQLDDFSIWLLFGIIIGGRLGYVLFYDPIKYLQHPVEILQTYTGGMSFHGGFTGVTIATYMFCRKHKLSFLLLTDVVSVVAPIGLCLGRVANFINAELYGRVTNVPWAIIFPNSILPRHPSQIYEALLEGLLLFVIMIYTTVYNRIIDIRGRTSALFVILYSIFRIVVECFREPDVNIGFIWQYVTMGQILSVLTLLIGSYLLYYTRCQSELRL